MDHQAQMNGRTDSAARSAARNVSDVCHDILKLSELQVTLVAIEARDTLEQTRVALCLIAAGGCLALASLVIFLTAAALFLVQMTSLTPASAFEISALAGIVIAGGLIVSGWWRLRRGFTGFQRSRCEWKRNMDWFKNMLARTPRQSDCT